MEELRIQTPRGNFKIQETFRSAKEAIENGYYYYFTNNDGTEILTKHFDPDNIHKVHFAIIKRR